MNRYKIYCNPEQTERAFNLGAPILTSDVATGCHQGQPDRFVVRKDIPSVLCIPTAEQMIGFILESGRGYSTDLSDLIREQGYKQGCLTFIDSCLK